MSPARLLPIVLLALAATCAQATEPIREFSSPAERQRYRSLLEDLRCMVCQNQSLARSNAALAEDMRDEVYRILVVEDRTREAVIDFLTERYGTYILYRPPLQPSTWLLWFAPALLLCGGGLVAVRFVRRRRGGRALTRDEHAHAQRLLDADGEDA